MKTIYIDCTGVIAPGQVWQRYIDGAKPEGAEFFGRNLDAFWDAIEGRGPGWPGDAKLVFTNSSALHGLRLPNGDSFLDGLRRIAKDATQTQIELV